MADDVELLTYDEIAQRLEITRESARQLVLRKLWTRRKGNDGRARIEVPFDALPPATSDATSVSTVDDTFEGTSDTTDLTRALTRHIERLEQALVTSEESLATRVNERDNAREEARAFERDRDVAREGERLLSSQLDGLRILMEANQRLTDLERQTAEQARADRDHWRDLASRPWWKRLAG